MVSLHKRTERVEQLSGPELESRKPKKKVFCNEKYYNMVQLPTRSGTSVDWIGPQSLLKVMDSTIGQ